MLDQDGYPTEETLDTLKNWNPLDYKGLVQFLQKLWKYPTYIRLEENVCYVSTGGWSGNEDLIFAINPVWEAIHFYQHTRGGHYIFTKNGREPNDTRECNEKEKERASPSPSKV